MGAVKLLTVEEVLKDVTKLGIDTSPIIYFVQSHPTYDEVVSLSSNKLPLVISKQPPLRLR